VRIRWFARDDVGYAEAPPCLVFKMGSWLSPSDQDSQACTGWSAL
jgi:hypothetical protein